VTFFPRRGFPSRLVTAAIGCALLAACSRGTDEPAGDAAPLSISGRPPVLLITLDTTRPDHLEPYGAADAETPALAGLARDGIVFEHAFATAPVTAPSHASILTGLYPPRHGVRNNLTHHLGDGIPTLADRLSAAGYRTAAFVSAIVLEARYGLDRGFEVYDDEIRAAGASRESRMTTERRAADTADRALAWLDGLGGENPFFLWVHFYDPHLPFSPPSPWAERFADRLYDGEIAYMDTQVARLLQHPRVAGGDALVVAMGDHGEGLGEHGEEAHGLLIYDSTIRVPWLMRLPGGPSGLRVEAPVSQVDLVPTLIELLSLEPAPGSPELEGRSLLPLLAGGGSLPERLLFAESEVPFFSYGWARLRSAYQWPLKLIDAPTGELYDLERDPGETRNLAPESSADTRRLAAAIESWAGADTGAGSTVGVDPEAEAQLRALGYLAGDTQRPAGEGRGNPVELMPVHDELQVVGTMLAEGRPREALERVRVALAMDPDNLAALRDLSRALTQLGRLDEAAAAADAGAGGRAVERPGAAGRSRRRAPPRPHEEGPRADRPRPRAGRALPRGAPRPLPLPRRARARRRGGFRARAAARRAPRQQLGGAALRGARRAAGGRVRRRRAAAAHGARAEPVHRRGLAAARDGAAAGRPARRRGGGLPRGDGERRRQLRRPGPSRPAARGD
jgi:choline-sulfatase